MVQKFINKVKLYNLISEKLKKLGIEEKDYPINSIDIARNHHENLKIELLRFPSTKIGGILYKGETLSSMALNSLRSEKGRNFDCMHELFHFWFHPPGQRLCTDDYYIHQSKVQEWQANEGAAQALMPKDLFMKKYIEYEGDIFKLSDFFFVGDKAVMFRINNLNLPKIQEKDLKRARSMKPFRYPIVKKPKEGMIQKERYCYFCKNISIKIGEYYCEICGSEAYFGTHGYNGINYKDEISLNSQNKTTLCPICGNIQIEHTDIYCSVCNTYLYQQCTNPSCNHRPGSNARYCSNCGSITTFYKYEILKKWETEAFSHIIYCPKD